MICWGRIACEVFRESGLQELELMFASSEEFVSRLEELVNGLLEPIEIAARLQDPLDELRVFRRGCRKRIITSVNGFP